MSERALSSVLDLHLILIREFHFICGVSKVSRCKRGARCT